MGKSRNKKKNHTSSASAPAPIPMEINSEAPQHHFPQAMDVAETNSSDQVLGVLNRKIKKGPSLRRTKKLKKLKAAKKAASNSEKLEEMMSKKKSKMARIQSAKSLYD